MEVFLGGAKNGLSRESMAKLDLKRESETTKQHLNSRRENGTKRKRSRREWRRGKLEQGNSKKRTGETNYPGMRVKA